MALVSRSHTEMPSCSPLEMNLDGVKLRSRASLRSYGSREGSGESSPVAVGSAPRRGPPKGEGGNGGYLEEIEKER